VNSVNLKFIKVLNLKSQTYSVNQAAFSTFKYYKSLQDFAFAYTKQIAYLSIRFIKFLAKTAGRNRLKRETYLILAIKIKIFRYYSRLFD